MQLFNKYIAGETGTVALQELDRLVGRYEWFTTARRAKALLSGKADPNLTLPLLASPTIPPTAVSPAPAQEVQPETPGNIATEDDIIGRFLEHGTYKIVPDETLDLADAVTDETFEDDEEGAILTEELAEIYRSQGLGAEAKEIYRKLSLLNPEKSIYFADIIARIDAETTNN